MDRLQQLLAVSFLVLGLFVDIGECAGASTSSPLSLTLTANTVEGTTDTIAFKAVIRNNGSTSQRLEAAWPYEQDNGDFKDYFLKSINLETNPPTIISTAQTGGAFRSSPQPSVILGPQEEISIDWTGSCGCLKPRDSLYCLAPCLREHGRYEVIASFLAIRDSTSRVRLRSEPVKLDFGRSSADPAKTVLSLKSIDAGTSTAILEGGSNQGVKAGQIWVFRGEGWRTWSLKIESVDSDFATGTYSIPVSGTTRQPVRNVLEIGSLFYRADTEKIPDCAK